MLIKGDCAACTHKCGHGIRIIFSIKNQLNSVFTAIRHYIQQTLVAAKGKVNGPDGAAALLGVHPNTLRNRMKKLNIPFGRKRAEGEMESRVQRKQTGFSLKPEASLET